MITSTKWAPTKYYIGSFQTFWFQDHSTCFVIIEDPSKLLLIWVTYIVFSEKAMAPHSSTLAWRLAWTEEPGRLQSMGSQRVGHDWASSLSHIGEGNGNPLQCSCLENRRDRGAWWAAIYGVTQSWTRLKWLSSSSSKYSSDELQ